MTIAFTAVEIRSPSRLRLAFSMTLDAGAFTSTAYYSVASVDGAGLVPAVNAAFVVPSAPHVVELSLDGDLTDGVPYTVSAIGVPATGGGGVTPAGSTLRFMLGSIRQSLRQGDTAASDVWTEIYGEDLLWNGQDYVEAPNGDLATIKGPENVRAAVIRDIGSDGLPWAPEYGGHLRRFVDGPFTSVAEVRGTCVKRALTDDRVRQAAATIVPPDMTDTGRSSIELEVALLGGEVLPATIPVGVA
jgi:hypothetical protein